MKKLLLLFLLIAGGVSTASAKTIYLENNWPGKQYISVCAGNSKNDEENTWTLLPKIGGRSNDNEVFAIDLEDAVYFRLAYGSEDANTRTGYFEAEEFTDGYCYQFQWEDENPIDGYNTRLRNGYALDVYSYSVSVSTKNSYDYLRIYPFNNDGGLFGTWQQASDMEKSENTYTYSFRALFSSVDVIFYHGTDQTCTMPAVSSSANVYYIASMSMGENQGESVKTNSYGYATFVSSLNLNLASGITYIAEDKGSWALAHTIESAPSGTAMLIKGDANTIYHFGYTGEASLSYTNAFQIGTSTTAESGLASQVGEKYNYILNGDAFYAAAGKKVAIGKAYLQLSSAVPAGARALVFEDGDVTGITNIKATKDNTYYNMQGIKVAQPTKGLYIMNGKKYLVK